jgi:hypothetical protein
MKIPFRHITRITFATISILLLLFMPESGETKERILCPGEKLTFEVRWSFILAGEVTLEILPYEEIDGLPAYHFLMTARTSKLVDIFYKVRDRMDSFTDIDMSHALRYIKLHKGREATVLFDWEKKEAQLISDGNVTNSTQIENNTFDPLSVFYVFRTAQPDKNNEITVYVADGKKTVKGTAKKIKMEKIKVNGNPFNAVLYEPRMEGVGGVFEKSEGAKMEIWVTDDDLRIPVRIKSKVAVGSFVADLVSYIPGDYTYCTPVNQNN